MLEATIAGSVTEPAIVHPPIFHVAMHFQAPRALRHPNPKLRWGLGSLGICGNKLLQMEQACRLSDIGCSSPTHFDDD